MRELNEVCVAEQLEVRMSSAIFCLLEAVKLLIADELSEELREVCVTEHIRFQLSSLAQLLEVAGLLVDDQVVGKLR